MRKYIGIFTTWMGLLAILSGPVQAGDNVVVVELYTSQGCSSCPPADDFLNKLAKKDDVIALGLHVDYWDYLGWKDELASPEFSARQRAYAHVARNRSVYTPQMVVGGRHLIVGHKVMEVMEHISTEKARNTGVSVNLERRGGKVVISAASTKRRKMTVALISYEPSVSVAIRRGENAGRTIEYANTVTQWLALKNWNGASALEISVNVKGDGPLVAIIQDVGPGQILAANRLR